MDTAITARVKTILRKARALIAAPENWTTCVSYRKVGGCESYCVSGAISSVVDAQNRVSPSEVVVNRTDLLAARDCLHDAIGISWFSLTSWNDYPGRTHAEVLQAFDSAIGGQRA